MLRTLAIRDFVIVDRLRLEFGAGFGALTGETGAGKSILVDALSLVLGGRADSAVVRAGRDRAEVSAEFDVSGLAGLKRHLADNDLAEDGDECILRRVVEAGGRSRAYVNGRPCTAAQLRETGEFLVDIYGQHEHQSLMRAASQRNLLDAYAGVGPLLREVAEGHRRWRDARQARVRAEEGAEALREERERVEWQVAELRKLGFSAEEWAELQSDHGRLAHAAALIEGAEASLEALSEGEGACVETVGSVLGRLKQLAAHDPGLGEVLEVLEPAEIQLREAAYALRHYRNRLDLDPQRLLEVEARIEAVVGMARRHRVPPERLPERLAELEARLSEVGERLDPATLRREEDEARRAYETVAARLTEQRRQAAETLGAAVTELMQSLAMAGGAFAIALSPLPEPSAAGSEQVEFMVRAHAGGQLRPVARVASGGELSRLSLAIQAVTSRVADVPTLVFDEVDSGIGGRVAEVVGDLLSRLGRDRQVLCITHLAQVAAAARHHWRVAKTSAGTETLSSVEALDAQSRVDEIARMLGGARITAATRQHAEEMLGAAAR